MTEKTTKKTSVIAGVLILISVFMSYICEFMYNFIINASVNNHLYHYCFSFVPGWFIFAMLLIAGCFIGTYFHKIVSYGVVGAFGIVLLNYVILILRMTVMALQNFSFEYFISILWSDVCSILLVLSCVLMIAYVILALNKHTFKGLKFWYAPGAVWLVAVVLGLISMVLGLPSEINQLANFGMGYGVAAIVSVAALLIRLVADILIPVGMALYTKYIYSLSRQD